MSSCEPSGDTRLNSGPPNFQSVGKSSGRGISVVSSTGVGPLSGVATGPLAPKLTEESPTTMSLPDVASKSARFASPLYLKSTLPGQVPISLVHFPVLSARNVPVAKTFWETSIVLVKTNAGNVASVTTLGVVHESIAVLPVSLGCTANKVVPFP